MGKSDGTRRSHSPRPQSRAPTASLRQGSRIPQRQNLSRAPSLCHRRGWQNLLLRPPDGRQADSRKVGHRPTATSERGPQGRRQTRRKSGRWKEPPGRTQGQAEGAHLGRVVGVLPGASRQAPKEELEGRRTAVQQVPARPSTTSGYPRSRRPSLPSGTAPLPRSTARFRRTDARPCWRRCFPRHRPPWATPAPIRPSACRTSPSDPGSGSCFRPK